MGPMEIAHDFPGRRMASRAEGRRLSLLFVNGQMTMEDGKETGNMSGRLLRHGAA